MDTKYFKSPAGQQNGNLGGLNISNGIIAVANEEEFEKLQKLRAYKEGGIIPIGKGINVEKLPDGSLSAPKVTNRFADAFTEAELVKINGIPDDVFEEEVLVNIRAIAEEYAVPSVGSATDEPTDTEPAAGENSDNQPENALPSINDFPNKLALQEALEEVGVVEYSSKATKAELYEMYLKAKGK